MKTFNLCTSWIIGRKLKIDFATLIARLVSKLFLKIRSRTYRFLMSFKISWMFIFTWSSHLRWRLFKTPSHKIPTESKSPKIFLLCNLEESEAILNKGELFNFAESSPKPYEDLDYIIVAALAFRLSQTAFNGNAR